MRRYSEMSIGAAKKQRQVMAYLISAEQFRAHKRRLNEHGLLSRREKVAVIMTSTVRHVPGVASAQWYVRSASMAQYCRC